MARDKLHIFKKLAEVSGLRSTRYKWILLISALIVTISSIIASRNVVNGDISVMAPPNAPSVKTLRELEKKFGATNTLIVLAVAPTGKDISELLDKIDRALSKSPYIERVDYRMETKFFEDRGLYYLTKEELNDLKDDIKKRIKRETIKRNPFYVDLSEEKKEEALPIDTSEVEGRFEGSSYVKNGYFRKVVDGGKREVWGLIVTPSKGTADVNYARKLVDDVEKRINSLNLPSDIELLMSGKYYYLATEARKILSDVRRISIIGSICVFIAVFCFFPNIFTLSLIFLPLLIGLAFDFAIVKFVAGELNVVTANIFAVLFGMSVAYGVHIYSRFREERKLGHGYEDAMERSIEDTGKAVFLSAGTTAGAFFILMTAKYKGFSQLGFITGLGVLFTFLTAIIVMPALGKLFNNWNLLRRHKYIGTTSQDLIKRWGEPPPLPKSIVATGIIFTIISIVIAPKLKFEMDYHKLSIKDPVREKGKEYESKLFGMEGEPAVTYANNEQQLREIIRKLEKIKETEGKYIIEKVISILSFIPKNQDEKYQIIKEIRKLAYDKKLNLAEGEEKKSVEKLRRMSSMKPFGINDIPVDVKRRFTGKEGGFLIFIYPMQDITNLSEAMKLKKLITNMEVGGRTISATNTTIVFAEVQDTMKKDAPIVILLSFLIVSFFILITFNSIKDSLLAMIPLSIGILWMLGMMSAFHQKINFFNIIAIPAVIGIGVDNGVHIVHRYRVEGIGSIRRIVRNISRTLFISTLTTVLGFGSLLFANHPGTRSLGLATILGLISTFLSAVFLLPSVIYLYCRASARILLRKTGGIIIWTISFDPLTEMLKHALRRKNVKFRIVTLDEMPYTERGICIRRIRNSVKGIISFPVIEKNGKIIKLPAHTYSEIENTVSTALVE